MFLDLNESSLLLVVRQIIQLLANLTYFIFDTT